VPESQAEGKGDRIPPAQCRSSRGLGDGRPRCAADPAKRALLRGPSAPIRRTTGAGRCPGPRRAAGRLQNPRHPPGAHRSSVRRVPATVRHAGHSSCRLRFGKNAVRMSRALSEGGGSGRAGADAVLGGNRRFKHTEEMMRGPRSEATRPAGKRVLQGAVENDHCWLSPPWLCHWMIVAPSAVLPPVTSANFPL
jgi:hypothetical protein